MRFGGLNVLYDEDRNSYPVDDVGQLYIPLEFAQDAGDGKVEVENKTQPKTEKDICQCSFCWCYM